MNSNGLWWIRLVSFIGLITTCFNPLNPLTDVFQTFLFQTDDIILSFEIPAKLLWNEMETTNVKLKKTQQTFTFHKIVKIKITTTTTNNKMKKFQMKIQIFHINWQIFTCATKKTATKNEATVIRCNILSWKQNALSLPESDRLSKK